MLKDLGYRFDPDDLEEWQIECYRLIENTINLEQDKESKRKRG
jgi:hypothetical protein